MSDVPLMRLQSDAVALLRRLIACDTSNPPGRETQAAAIVEDYLHRHGVRTERVAKDPERANLLARLPGAGAGPSLLFLGHLDVVPVRRADWSVEPFAGVEQDGAIWGRGAIDMKCQVASTAVALASLAAEGFRPQGDLMLGLMADEEVGSAGVGSPFFVDAKADLQIDYLIGEGAGERLPTGTGPIYLLDHGVKSTATATITVHGIAGDASLPDTGPDAVAETARLLSHLRDYRSPLRVDPAVRPLIDLLAPGGADDDARVRAIRSMHPALDRLLGGLVGSVLQPTRVCATGPANVTRSEARIHVQCVVLPGVTRDELENELRAGLGEGSYDLEVTTPKGGSTSPLDTPLHEAIEAFLAQHDPEARLVPTLAYGYSDCHTFRESYGCVAYGFIPFRHADPMSNLTTKHGGDEHVLVDDLAFQVLAARSIAMSIGAPG